MAFVQSTENVFESILQLSFDSNATSKRKRRPAGTPDPDAEVVALSPRTLMESDRYVCEICNQGFQREQNLQMHRRRHKVPWKLLKKPTPDVKKRVYVCPDPTCLHNDPGHALGDLVGIKKHFRRKHSLEKQWKCEKCSKAYAVQSDYKAHLKTCGTRGHSCDCGRVFSRVESFIQHQDNCATAKEKMVTGGGGFSEQCNINMPPLKALSSSSNESNKYEEYHLSLTNKARELQLLPSSNMDTSGNSINNRCFTYERERQSLMESHHQHQQQYQPNLELSIGFSSEPEHLRTIDHRVYSHHHPYSSSSYSDMSYCNYLQHHHQQQQLRVSAREHSLYEGEICPNNSASQFPYISLFRNGS